MSTWGTSFTAAERAAHAVARARWEATGGVPNLRIDEDVVEPPSPWAEIRRTVVGRWHKAFKNRRNDDRDELLSYVLLCVAIRFDGIERAAPGLVVAYAAQIVDREIADLKRGVRRKRSGLLSLVNDPRRTKLYEDSPVYDDDGFDTPRAGAGGEFRGSGVCSVPECPRDAEDEMIASLDARRGAALHTGLREYLRPQEIDVSKSLFAELGWGEVDFITRESDGLTPGFSSGNEKDLSDDGISERKPNSRDAA
jgi:hypothetical protein